MTKEFEPASPEELMRQAPLTTAFYLEKAVTLIDKQFGDGYAEKNPQLVGAFLQACSTDYLAAVNEAYVSTHLERLSRAVQK